MTKGKCYFCDKILGRVAMEKHLSVCEKREEKTAKNNPNNIRMFQLFIQCLYAKDFWMYIGINPEKPFLLLDEFLRKIWLECCNHLSMFEVNGVRYSSHPEGEISLRIKLYKSIRVGTTFLYKYDFGNSTDIKIIVEKEYKGLLPEDKNIEVLARNEIPNVKCKCGNNPKYICSKCMKKGLDDYLFCESCLEYHQCERESVLPFVNSPRVGICNYKGLAEEIKYF